MHVNDTYHANMVLTLYDIMFFALAQIDIQIVFFLT